KPQTEPVRHLDGKPVEPHAPPYVVEMITRYMPADQVTDPEIVISDYGASFSASQKPSPSLSLRTPIFYHPPEGLFNEELT
ncbi:hypothetical protein QBC46DRAFT_217697, partial [Diplogelasinospora grovesii]